MYIFIGNLAFSDLLAGLAFMANTLLSGATTFNLTPVQWFVREGTAFATLAASVFSLLAIAIERHVAITKVKVYSSDKNSTCGIAPPSSPSTPNVTSSSSSPSSPSSSSPSSGSTAASTTVTIVLGAFIVCWLPAFIILLMDASCPVRACQILYKANYFFAFAMLNSAANPIIYTLRSKDMRREFLRVLCCCGAGRRAQPPGRCGLPLRTSSSLDRCTPKYELPTSPITRECTTSV
ncbi:PREDICTED: sphingosine 1-phosphate receptor 2 [Nipponia nippon]|uniref:sphingosine 1-phosphate receptor 2 n=1 Tax=Nipponia nippon TaxID=128390 RepID=UPI000510B9BF|nr:PREDICTED: sphingosine 1-phosphate receptor 2 [Nipponia nippon]